MRLTRPCNNNIPTIILKCLLQVPVLVLFIAMACQAQVDTNSIKRMYDRVLDFDETKRDSALYYANYIEQQSAIIQFKKGKVLSLRLRGMHKEFKNDYDSAIYYYYQSLEEARRLQSKDYEVAALSDLALAYYNINQFQKTKDFYKEALDLAMIRKEASSIFTNSTNLGSIYNKLNQPDSALLHLEYAQQLADEYKGKFDLSSLHNNLGNAWFYKKNWDKALYYFWLNYNVDIVSGNSEMLWYDCLNIGDVFRKKQQYDSAKKYLDQASLVADALGSKRKKAEVHSLYAKFYADKGDYKAAYNNFDDWYRIDTSLIKEQTIRSVSEMQEKYQSKQKELENQQLGLEIVKQKLHKRNLLFLVVALAVLAVAAVIVLLLIRKKNNQLEVQNQLIQKQNEKLSQFNVEKNSLISVVSHDLSGPFTSIKMWSQILMGKISNFTEEQKNALYRIQSSADNGEMLIRNILYIEKEQINNHVLKLEQMDVNAFLEDIIQIYHQQALQKNIRIIYTPRNKPLITMSDRNMLTRICENLLSNAIKFTEREQTVSVFLEEEPDLVRIKVADEGVGISPEEIPFLFSKYKKISSMPTEGEYSTGLGLSIVKRLVEELNGKIECKSILGAGSTFILTLYK